jgi:putative cell wall-binding protein
MTRDKNIDSRKNAIITLATANDYKSIPELSKLIDKKFQTINNYFKEIDISNLIESKQFNNPTVNGIKPIKYKFKSGIENLLAVFEYLETKQYPRLKYYCTFENEYNKSAYSLVKYNNILKAMNSRTSGMTTYIGL